MNTNKRKITANKQLTLNVDWRLVRFASCRLRQNKCLHFGKTVHLKKKKKWNSAVGTKKVLPQLFWGKGWMPKETLASMNISLPIMTNCDNCPQPNSTNATAENCSCLRFEIWDVCSKCACFYSFSVFEFVHYFMNLNYNIVLNFIVIL